MWLCLGVLGGGLVLMCIIDGRENRMMNMVWMRIDDIKWGLLI